MKKTLEKTARGSFQASFPAVEITLSVLIILNMITACGRIQPAPLFLLS
ncbi:MAG: hypothetical protein LBU32_25935 [Clostridiales bacterium]|nr:hypothetical protein [Clostridiales bacterium]